MTRRIKLRAQLPAIQNAITFSGNGCGARVMLDVPDEYRKQVAKLLELTETDLEVTFRVAPEVE